jgi:hypothetical protein
MQTRLSAPPRASLAFGNFRGYTGTRDNEDLVFSRTPTEAFFASTIRARVNKAWKAAGLEPITPREARHCASSYFIAAGLDWKQISTWAGHGDVRQTWNRYGHLTQAEKRQPRLGSMPISSPRTQSLNWSQNRLQPQTTATKRSRAKTRLQTGRAIRLWRTPLKTRNPP